MGSIRGSNFSTKESPTPAMAIAESDNLFTPNEGGQQQFMDDYTHRYCALAGGWFAGKTWAGARKLMDLHVYNAFDLQNNQPTFVKSAVIAPTYQLAQDFDIPELRLAMDEMNISHKFMGDKTQFKFVMPDLGTRRVPSEILIRTADSPDRITGWTVGAIWGDEAARWFVDDQDPIRDPFMQADGRLRDPRANFLQFMITFTHEGDMTKVYRDYEENPKPDHVLYRAGSFQNPYAEAFVKVQRNQLSPELVKQYIDGGVLVLRGNAVYPAFDKRLEVGNVSEKVELVDNLPLQLTIDFNINPGMHALIGQFNKDLPMVTTVHEIFAKRMNTLQMLQQFKAIISQVGWKFPRLEVYGDASKDTNAQNGRTNWDIVIEWLRHNFEYPWSIQVPDTNPGVGDRVNAVNCAMKAMNGKVKYRVHKRCVELIQDFETQKWEGNEPSKEDRKRSHSADADGYRIWRLMPIRRMFISGGKVSTVAQS